MSIFKDYKIHLVGLTVFIALILAGWKYIDIIQNEKEELQRINYQRQALDMQKRVASLIVAKQKSTVAMALSLANNEALLSDVLNDEISSEYYQELIDKFKNNTLFKNIWIQVLDKNIVSKYRSWSDKRGDSLREIREDLVEVLNSKEVTYSISAGKFDLTIKAIVPILRKQKIVGVLEVISHFNSISKEMKSFDVDSVVVLDKKFTKQLEQPFTKMFINNYYVANFDAPYHLREHLKEHEMLKHFTTSYLVENANIATSYELKSLNGETLGWYIMFKKIEDISSIDLDFFMFKWLAIGLLSLMAVAGIINIIMFYFLREQKKYYENIIDSSTNIVIINSAETIIDTNKIFFKYFYKYEALDDFKVEHDCICDFFVEEEGYIQRDMDGVPWVDYIIQNSKKRHKVKIKYDGKLYYFSASGSLVSKEKNYFSVVLSDITQEEKYKIDLEKQSITDPLTGIGNRRYFQTKIKEEISSSKRYEHTLSLVMLDIDYFKKVNDEHGHGVGDSVLIEYTKLISSSIRDGDIFCRIGGEEFMIILPYTAKESAAALAEKLRAGVQNHKKILPITMSFGVVEYIQGEDVEYILKRVDEALYKAKESGRNRVVSL